MGVLPIQLIKQNLGQVDVFLEDINNEFIVVQDLPDTFSQGRSTFKIFGSDFLKKGVELKIELLDKSGDTVYIAPIRYRYNNDNPTLPFTYVSVEVYGPKINTGGVAELVILGELDSDRIEIPSEYIGRYNVRFRKNINLDLSKTVNTAPILFYKKPTVKTTEFVTKRLVPPGDNTTITKIISGSGLSGFSLNAGNRYYPDPTKTVGGTVGETPPNTDTTDTQTESPSIKEAPGGDFKQLDNLKAFKTGEVKKPAVLKKINRPELFTSSEPPVMKIFATGSGTFTSDMVGGEIRIPKEKIFVHNPKQFIGDGNVGIGTGFRTFPEKLTLAGGETLEGAKIFIPDYTASIERVVNDKEIHVKEPFYFQYGDGVETKYYLANFGNAPVKISEPGEPRSDFTMSFIETVASTTSSFAFDSSLEFNIKNLRTFSGDVYRLRISGGSKTRVSDFPILLDTTIESPELLIDSTSATGFLRSGYIQNQTHLDKYWSSSSNLTPTFRSSNIIDAVHLSGSLSEKNAVGRFSLKTDYAFELNKDVVYELKMNVVGIKGTKKTDTSQDKKAILKFHISGSNIPSDKNPKYTDANSFGKTINDEFGNVVGLELDSNSPDEFDYGRVSHTFKMPFKANRVTNTDTILQFRVEAGEWDISDISLRPAMDTGFSPDNVKIRVPIPTNTQRPDKFQFILQYYDVNNNEAEEITFVDDVDVQGESLLIQGNDNLLTGTLSMGNVQGEGVEMVGGNSAFIRAIGYTGFTDARAGTGGGFFLWSGSVAPGGETQDNYDGAGLEIHDGNTGANESFFKFRTNDADNGNNSTFDIRTSRFFLGQEDSTFVSGALGNIEISSSNLHLTREGNITASNFQMNSGVIRDTVQILGSVSANSILTPATINGSPANVLNASSSIKSDGLARFASASIGGFQVTPNQIKSTNENLILSSDGNITGTSGTIGGFTLGDTTLTGGSLVLDRNGTIRSANFQDDLAGSGFKLTADDGGFLEVENARIRGTLKTAVFEKETVNAVGGELYIANSTVLTGSSINPGGIHAPTQNTMSVENASGFEEGEILRLKKVSPTGFSTEYVFVESSSRNDPSSDTDFSGNLFVTRSFGNGISGVSSSVGETAGAAVSYSGSQVVVSTGRYISGDAPNTIGSGYMRLNARPTDAATPFMDIVERTGSGIYDVELKTRLGDLSGVAGTRNVPAGFTGFGLMTETAFLSGSNIKLEAPRFLLGDLNSNFVSGSNNNIEISSSRFHLQPGGDTVMQGKVTATSGRIGGFSITNDNIEGEGVIIKGTEGSQSIQLIDKDGSSTGVPGRVAAEFLYTEFGIKGNDPRPGPTISSSIDDIMIVTDATASLFVNPGVIRGFRTETAPTADEFSVQGGLSEAGNRSRLISAPIYGANSSNRSGSNNGHNINAGLFAYQSQLTNTLDTNLFSFRGAGLYALVNGGAGSTAILATPLKTDRSSFSGVFHGGRFVVGDVFGREDNDEKAHGNSVTDSDYVLVAYPNDIDGGLDNTFKGRVGINNYRPATELHVKGTISGSSLINSSGDIVAFQSSDKRLKDNLTHILNPIEKVKQINGYEFDWNDKQDIYKGHDVGVIAQEVEKIMPELVRDNSNGYKAVKYEKLVPLLIESIKDQQKQIDELKKKLEEL